ncbi:MAG: hypothetical protein ABR985_18630 [Methanotrichaceae archaeon]
MFPATTTVIVGDNGIEVGRRELLIGRSKGGKLTIRVRSTNSAIVV